MLQKIEKIAMGQGRILLMDSISYIEDDTRPKDLIVCASHGGFSAAEYVLDKSAPGLVIFNDAGVGKENAGIEALAMLEEKCIAAATVSHNSARIGDVQDTYDNGVVSHLNATAAALNIVVGMTVREVCEVLLNPKI